MNSRPNTITAILDTSGATVTHCADKEIEQQLTVETIQDVPAFDEIQSEWSELVANSNAHIFQTYEWQRLWWKFFGGNRTLHIVLIRQNGKLVGVVPFFMEPSTFLGTHVHHRLRLLGCGVSLRESAGNPMTYGPSDYLDIIALPEFENDVANTLAKYLDEHTELYDSVEMNDVPQDAIVLRALLPALDEIGWKYKISRSDICPRLYAPGSGEEFMRSLRPKVRYHLSQARKAATNQGLFSIEGVHSLEELEYTFEVFVKLHQRRWNRRGHPGAFADNRFQRFLKEVLKTFFKRDWLWFKTANAGGKCIAVQSAFKFKDRVYDYMKAFDDESPAAKRRPGLALLLWLINDAIHNKFRVVDFLRGGEPYKFELTSHGQFNWHIVIPNRIKRAKLRSLIFLVVASFSYVKRQVAKEALFLRTHFRHQDRRHFIISYATDLISRIVGRLNRLRDPGPISRIPETYQSKCTETLDFMVVEKDSDL